MRRFLSVLIICFVCCCAFSSEVRSLKTEHFEIIFQEESSRTAQEIFQGCEQVYDRVCALIGNTGEKLFFPVVIRSDEKIFNAYYTGYPYNVIVLHDTFSTPDNSMNMPEKMLGVFEHELTHALLFNHRNKFWKAMGDIFCDGFSIQGLYVHPMFSEGLSVYSESRNGAGRLNDPFFMHEVKQAKLDGAFPSWFEASGGMDLGTFRDSAYTFGGPFVNYLAHRFGENKLGEFFTQTTGLVFRTVPLIFRDVFGIDIDAAWNDFRDSIQVPSNLLVPDKLIKAGSYSNVTGLNDTLYVLNSHESSVDVFDMNTGLPVKSIPSYGASALSVAGDGLLILGITNEHDCSVLITSEDGVVIRRFDGYHQGFVSDDGYLGLVGNRKNCCYIDFYDRNEDFIGMVNLGYGTDAYCFSPYGRGYVSFILVKDGISRIAFVNPSKKTVYVTDNPDGYIFRSVSGNTFSWMNKNVSDATVRFGTFEFDGVSADLNFCQADYDGGTWWPYAYGDKLFFVGKKSAFSGLYSTETVKEFVSRNYAVLQYDVVENVSEIRASKFNSTPYLFKGTFIPLAGYSDEDEDLIGLGFTYLTEDPFKRWTVKTDAGYNFEDEIIFGELAVSENLSPRFSFYQDGKFKYSHEDDKFSFRGNIEAEFRKTLLSESVFSCSLFVAPEYEKDLDVYAGAKSSFSVVKNKGMLPFEYLGLNLSAGLECGIFNTDETAGNAAFSLHIPHLFKTDGTSVRYTYNLPVDIAVETDFEKDIRGCVSVIPFAMELQKGLQFSGLFFNRFVTNAGWICEYNVKNKDRTDRYFVCADFTLTPAIGMLYGNVFGKLGVVLEYSETEDISATLRFSVSI